MSWTNTSKSRFYLIILTMASRNNCAKNEVVVLLFYDHEQYCSCRGKLSIDTTELRSFQRSSFCFQETPWVRQRDSTAETEHWRQFVHGDTPGQHCVSIARTDLTSSTVHTSWPSSSWIARTFPAASISIFWSTACSILTTNQLNASEPASPPLPKVAHLSLSSLNEQLEQMALVCDIFSKFFYVVICVTSSSDLPDFMFSEQKNELENFPLTDDTARQKKYDILQKLSFRFVVPFLAIVHFSLDRHLTCLSNIWTSEHQLLRCCLPQCQKEESVLTQIFSLLSMWTHTKQPSKTTK